MAFGRDSDDELYALFASSNSPVTSKGRIYKMVPPKLLEVNLKDFELGCKAV